MLTHHSHSAIVRTYSNGEVSSPSRAHACYSPVPTLAAAGCWLPSCTLNTCSEFTDFRVQNQLRRYRVVCSSSSSTLPGRVLGPLSLSALSLERAEREREGEDERGESIACRDPTQPKRTMQCCFCLVANPWRHCQ